MSGCEAVGITTRIARTFFAGEAGSAFIYSHDLPAVDPRLPGTEAKISMVVLS